MHMKSIDILKMIASDFKKAYQHENGWNKALIWLDFLVALLNFSTGNWLGGVFMLALAFWMLSSAVNSLHLDEVLAYASALEKLVERWHREAEARLEKIEELKQQTAKTAKTAKKRKLKKTYSKSRRQARKTKIL